MASILIIEDEQRIREELAGRLAERGHDIEAVGKAMDGVHLAVSGDHVSKMFIHFRCAASQIENLNICFT